MVLGLLFFLGAGLSVDCVSVSRGFIYIEVVVLHACRHNGIVFAPSCLAGTLLSSRFLVACIFFDFCLDGFVVLLVRSHRSRVVFEMFNVRYLGVNMFRARSTHSSSPSPRYL